MSLILTSPPAIEPISLAVARQHCRIDGTDDDDLLSIYITAARMQCEDLTSRALITQTWDQVLDAFPAEAIKLLKPPVLSVPSLTYVDAAGVTQTLASSLYALDAATPPSGWVLPADGSSWPDTDDVVNAVRLTLVCGYGPAAADVPAPLRSWMLLTLGYLYDQRTAVDMAAKSGALPDRFYHSLLDPYIVFGL